MQKPLFETLASSISEQERKELLKKINYSINSETKPKNSIYASEFTREQKKNMIREGIRKLSFIQKLKFFLKKIFTGKNEEKIFTEYQLDLIKKRINERCRGISNFDTGAIKPLMAEFLYRLYINAKPLEEIMKLFWKNEKVINAVLTGLMEREIKRPATCIDDLFTDEERENILFREKSKIAFKQEINKALIKYLSSIPENIFKNAEKKLMPFYCMREIILFPYEELFSFFNFDPGLKSNKMAKPVSADIILDYLERLYCAIYAAMKISQPIKIPEDLFTVREEGPPAPEKEKQEETDLKEEDEEDDDENDLYASDASEKEKTKKLLSVFEPEKISVLMEKLIIEIEKFDRQVPLRDLIKYYKNNIFYRIMFYAPKLRMRDFYSASLRIILLKQIDPKYQEMKNRQLKKDIDDMFKNFRKLTLSNYRLYTKNEYCGIRMDYLRSAGTMELLYNWLIDFYCYNIREKIEAIAKYLLIYDKDISSGLTTYASILDDLALKIRDFDSSLSPEQEDGKLLNRLFINLGSGLSYLKMYKNMINDKNKKTKEIISRANESIEELKKIFSSILFSKSSEISKTLGNTLKIENKSASLKEHIEKILQSISSFSMLFNQQIESE